VTRPGWQRLILVVSLVLVGIATIGSVAAMIRIVLFNG
jgi:preprotein translocase subunit Sss1